MGRRAEREGGDGARGWRAWQAIVRTLSFLEFHGAKWRDLAFILNGSLWLLY